MIRLIKLLIGDVTVSTEIFKINHKNIFPRGCFFEVAYVILIVVLFDCGRRKFVENIMKI